MSAVTVLPEGQVHISPDSVQMVNAVAEHLVSFLREATAGRSKGDPVEVGISGGFTTSDILPALLPYMLDVDWSRVRFWWVDERFVPKGDKDRNNSAAISAVLQYFHGVRWVSMPADEGQGLEFAGEAFLSDWTKLMSGSPLDVVLLGMGPDAHVASLFPGDEWTRLGTESPDVLVVADSPKPPAQRITLSMSVLHSARKIIVATAGAAKASAVKAVLGGADYVQFPASALITSESADRVHVYVDSEAASLLNISK